MDVVDSSSWSVKASSAVPMVALAVVSSTLVCDQSQESILLVVVG